MIDKFKLGYWYKLQATKTEKGWDWNPSMNPILENRWFKCIEGGEVHARFEGEDIDKCWWNWDFCKHLFIESKYDYSNNKIKKSEEILKNWK